MKLLWFVAIITSSGDSKAVWMSVVFFTNGSWIVTIAPALVKISTSLTDGEFLKSSLPDLNEIPKTVILFPNRLPVIFFKFSTICCGIDSFNFHAAETILANGMLFARKVLSLLKHGPPANPGIGILHLS